MAKTGFLMTWLRYKALSPVKIPTFKTTQISELGHKLRMIRATNWKKVGCFANWQESPNTNSNNGSCSLRANAGVRFEMNSQNYSRK